MNGLLLIATGFWTAPGFWWGVVGAVALVVILKLTSGKVEVKLDVQRPAPDAEPVRLLHSDKEMILHPTEADLGRVLGELIAAPADEENFFILELADGFVQGQWLGEGFACEYRLGDDPEVQVATEPLRREEILNLLKRRLAGDSDWRQGREWKPLEIDENLLPAVISLGTYVSNEARKLLDVLHAADIEVEMVQTGATAFELQVASDDVEKARALVNQTLGIC